MTIKHGALPQKENARWRAGEIVGSTTEGDFNALARAVNALLTQSASDAHAHVLGDPKRHDATREQRRPSSRELRRRLARMTRKQLRKGGRP